MADFNEPRNDTLASLVLDRIKEQILSVAKLFIGTSDSNVPDGVVRYNESTKHFQKKNGASYDDLNFHAPIDSHIADTTLHAGVPTGSVLPFAGAVAPTGFVFCQGQALSRTTESALFTAIGTTFGVGDGSTTFNVPNLKSRFPLGRDTAGSYQTLGQTGGSLDHTHSVASHQHTLASHQHTITHTHSTPAHAHSLAAHTHLVYGHGHSAENPNATINIDASAGAHQHNINRRANGGSYSADNRCAMPPSSGSEDYVLTRNDTQGNHGHGHSSVKGTVGNWNGGGSGLSGDSNQWSGPVANVVSPGNEGAGTTGPSSDPNTGASGTLTTTAGEGSGTTGSANPAYIILNYIIKT